MSECCLIWCASLHVHLCKKQNGQMLRQINLNIVSLAKQHSIKYHTDKQLKFITFYQ